jgi:signal transduction histidine kinase
MYFADTPYARIWSFRDITQQKRAEEELSKLAKLESLGILAGGIAHNFKNMLTAMSMSTELARIKPQKASHYLNKISKSIDQASALATKFQTFSKSGALVLNPADINGVITDAAEIVLSGSSATVRLDLESGIPQFLIDDKQINEVITNLLINANQAMPSGGNIYISTYIKDINHGSIHGLDAGKYVGIDIRDEGIGIPETHLNEIFTPFFTTKNEGQGLGLASVFFIIEKHKGYITVDSEMGKGTKFSIYLPMTGHEINDSESEEGEISFSEKLRILLLDDDPEIIDTIGEMAENLNVEMVCTRNPYQAIDIYKNDSESFDLVILDLTSNHTDSKAESKNHSK